jgi:hypothetical protein
VLEGDGAGSNILKEEVEFGAGCLEFEGGGFSDAASFH